MRGETTRIDYVSGLDGLRGFCLAAVMLYHAPYPWFSGAFLSVSTFFTLSGYLITTLLLRELSAGGSVDLAQFWARRSRRLGPALSLTVALVLVTSPAWMDDAARERLGGDALSALFFVSNWRFMSADYAYVTLFAAPSALQHCWTLAIEAQYYLVLPVLMRCGSHFGGVRGVTAALIAMTGLSVAAGWLAIPEGQASYRGYYGTDIRSSELLIGALLAVAIETGRLSPRSAGALKSNLVGFVSIVAVMVAWVWVDLESPWLYRGGFTAYACLSAAVVYAILAGRNPASTFLNLTPLPWLGQVSYGAYLFHWPIFLWLTEARTGLPRGPLFALRVALTLVLAWGSYRWIEEPVRRRRLLVGRGRLALATLASALVGFGVLWAFEPSGFAREPDARAESPANRVLKFSVFGDSTAANLSLPVSEWMEANGMASVEGHAWLGCSMLDDGTRRVQGEWRKVPPACRELMATWSDVLEIGRPDVAIVLIGAWDLRDRRLPGEDRVRVLGDPTLDAVLRDRLRAAVEQFRSHGVKAIWLTFPRSRFPPGPKEPPEEAERASDPARVRKWNEILRDVAQENPGDVHIIDFAGYLEERPGGPFDPEIRSDGLHFTRPGRASIAAWLGPRVVSAALDLVPERPDSSSR